MIARTAAAGPPPEPGHGIRKPAPDRGPAPYTASLARRLRFRMNTTMSGRDASAALQTEPGSARGRGRTGPRPDLSGVLPRAQDDYREGPAQCRERRRRVVRKSPGITINCAVFHAVRTRHSGSRIALDNCRYRAQSCQSRRDHSGQALMRLVRPFDTSDGRYTARNTRLRDYSDTVRQAPVDSPYQRSSLRAECVLGTLDTGCDGVRRSPPDGGADRVAGMPGEVTRMICCPLRIAELVAFASSS